MIRLDRGRRKLRLTDAAKEIGIAPITLKRWLLQGKVADVHRDRNGWRMFTMEDLERIRDFANSTDGSSEPHPRFKVASFFSGIGGFDLGFEKAGFEVTFQCEIDSFCKEILRKHWPEVPRWDNIKTLEYANVPISDVWVGGFPCQDLSLARMGKRDGLGGSKSRLFYDFARLVGEANPRVIVIENVAGLLSAHEGKDFGTLIQTLAQLGYAVGWRTFNSQYFGVPQSRQRVYIVGCRGDWRGPGSILFESECGQGNPEEGGKNGQKTTSPFQTIIGNPGSDGPVIQSIAYCLYATSARHTGTDWSRNYVCYPKGGRIRRLTPDECEGVMAFPKGWTIPDLSHLSHTDLDSARYHALGNAVTPPVAEWIAKRIALYMTQNVDGPAINPAKTHLPEPKTQDLAIAVC